MLAVNLKYGIQSSRGTIHRVLKMKETILESMKNATKGGLNRKRLIRKERADFEAMLDFNLRQNYRKEDVNREIAKKVAEEICQQNPAFQSCLQQIKFQPNYFKGFFKRLGWK